jgi:hypothetical protein
MNRIGPYALGPLASVLSARFADADGVSASLPPLVDADPAALDRAAMRIDPVQSPRR